MDSWGALINHSRRVFLFLQGPISPFFERVALALKELGHDVRRVNLYFGDRLLWRRLPAVNYTGTPADWPQFIDAYMEREGVTDLIMLGDRRPLHIQAANLARARGTRVFACELGYLRPDWITLERNGMSSYSHFPTDPETIQEIAERVPQPDLKTRFHSSFYKLAAWDVAYNLALSQRRGEAVRQYLQSESLKVQIDIRSLGKSEPIKESLSEQDYAWNRRAEFRFE